MLTPLVLASLALADPNVPAQMRAAQQADIAAAAVPPAEPDQRYLIAEGDVVATIVAALERNAPVTTVNATTIANDWTYGGNVGLDESGEYYDQSRSRSYVTYALDGAEMVFAGRYLTETRRIRPKGTPEAWVPSESDLGRTGIDAALAGLEPAALSTLALWGTGGIDDFVATMPGGFEVQSRNATTLFAVRDATVREDKKKGKKWDQWDHHETLSVDATGNAIQVTATNEHRLSSEKGEGPWMDSPVNPSVTADWTASAARWGLPAGHFRYATSLLAPVAARELPLSPPPPPPALRTIAQLQPIITERAYESRTGRFSVCLDHVIVSPVDGNSQDWDPADQPAELDGLTTSTLPTGALGALNGESPASPTALESGGMASLNDATIDKEQIAAIGSQTQGVTGWTKKGATRPDLVGSVTIGSTKTELPLAKDAVRLDPQACAVAEFEDDGPPAVTVEIWDVDGEAKTGIGSCRVDLHEVLDQGLVGVPCGLGRVYVSARHQFSYDQIEIVGLPAAE